MYLSAESPMCLFPGQGGTPGLPPTEKVSQELIIGWIEGIISKGSVLCFLVRRRNGVICSSMRWDLEW